MSSERAHLQPSPRPDCSPFLVPPSPVSLSAGDHHLFWMSTALGSESFVAFELSPEPEPIPQPPPAGQASSSTSSRPGPHPPSGQSSSRAGPSAKGKEVDYQGGKLAQKRSREQREKEEREARDPNHPDSYRNKKEQDNARSRATPWTEGIDWE